MEKDNSALTSEKSKWIKGKSELNNKISKIEAENKQLKLEKGNLVARAEKLISEKEKANSTKAVFLGISVILFILLIALMIFI